MKNLNQIADELLHGCPEDALEDHEAIAEALRRGDSAEQIMSMDELDSWPDTYFWLQSELEGDE